MKQYQKYPSYCCNKCGEPIGWLGRFFQFCQVKFHTCEVSEYQE